MWQFKSCPRCGGDIHIDKDEGRWYQQCLQCGYERELESIVEVKKPQLAKRRPTKAV